MIVTIKRNMSSQLSLINFCLIARLGIIASPFSLCDFLSSKSEQVDRLSRLDDTGWAKLQSLIQEKHLNVISLDLPTSHAALQNVINDDFTASMLKAINNMMLDMLAAIARKDYQDSKRRQAEGIIKAKQQGKFKGRQANLELHKNICQLRLDNGLSIADTARLTGVSERTVIRVTKSNIVG